MNLRLNKKYSDKLAKIVISFGFAFILFSTMISVVSAATTGDTRNYTVLAPLPGTYDVNNGKTTLATYLPGVFKFGIGIAALLAFVMITAGGIQYMTSDALSGKEQGRERITNAIYGLLLAIGAYTILYTINPKMLEFDLNIVKPAEIAATDVTTVPTPPTTESGAINQAGVPMTQAQIDADTAVRNTIKNQNSRVSVNSGPCLQGQTSGCTNVNGLSRSVIDGLTVALQPACGGCQVIITGGTEPGHTTGSCHNYGKCVDLSSDTKLNSTITNGAPLVECKTYTINTGSFLWEPKGSTCGGEVASSADHWHVTF